MKATFNITNNRFKFYPEEIGRLPADQYKKAKDANFVWYPGQKCFSAIWTPQAEDFILSYGIEIVEDDTPDNLEARVERFEKYAENDERTAEHATERAFSANTSRQREQAGNTVSSKLDEAAYWHGRIAGAIHNAQHKDRPDVIVRRIKGIEKDLRKHQGAEKELHSRIGLGWLFSDFQTASNLPYETRIGDLTEEQREAYEAYVIGRCERSKTHNDRWISHLEKRLQYETAYLEAIGGDPRNNVTDVKVGDVIEYNGEECEIWKVGKVNLIINIPSHTWNRYGHKIGREEAGAIVGHIEQAPKPKATKSADGIEKGCTVEWTEFYGGHLVTFTSKVVKASPKTLQVELPNDPKYFEYSRERCITIWKVIRRKAKVVEVA